ncbi:MAG: glycosyltransferase family 4 protein [Candidatus Thorarchaeota archaeon]|nr:glycosyltransferase family 4 protein [Candidatus Thorarchaeota archaeon]
MRILHLCDSLNPAGLGGYESHLHYLSKEMAKYSHESYIVTQSPNRNSPESIDHDNYKIIHLPGNYLEARKWVFFSAPEESRENLVDQLFEPNDMESNVDELKKQLLATIDVIKPDIIHAHSTYVVFNRVLHTLVEDGKIKQIPLVATIHGLSKPLILPSGEKTTDYNQLVQFCPFDLFLAVSDTVAVTLREHLSPIGLEHIVKRHYIGINLDAFRPDSKMKKKWDIAFLGRLEPMKSVDVFPEMLEILKKTHPDLKMVMTGEGSLRQSVLEEFSRRDVAYMVDYLGVVETSEVANIINSAKIFLYPSRMEPFGLSVIEAMACSVPVVTSNVYGPSEIITHEKDGLTVTPGDAVALASAIKRLLSDSELYDQIRNNARSTVQERFDIQVQTKKLVDIYTTLLAEKKVQEE